MRPNIGDKYKVLVDFPAHAGVLKGDIVEYIGITSELQHEWQDTTGETWFIGWEPDGHDSFLSYLSPIQDDVDFATNEVTVLKPGSISPIGKLHINKSTALRFNEGKPRLALNDLGREVAEAEARVWENGIPKYGFGNWLKGQKLSTCMDSVKRHFTAIMNGEFIDTESGLPHVAHLITSSKIAAHSYLTKPELNDIKEIIGD